VTGIEEVQCGCSSPSTALVAAGGRGDLGRPCLGGERSGAVSLDLLWFGEVGKTQVFWEVLGAEIGLGLVTGLGTALIVGGNLWIAQRIAVLWVPYMELTRLGGHPR
jgi:hypothetical protein